MPKTENYDKNKYLPDPFPGALLVPVAFCLQCAARNPEKNVQVIIELL